MASALQAAYDARIAAGEIRPDPAQADGLARAGRGWRPTSPPRRRTAA